MSGGFVMGLVQSVLLLVLMCVNGFLPGYFLLRRLRWSATEILCCSIALSFVLIYLTATLVYFTGIDWRACWVDSAASCALGIMAWGDIRRFVQRPMVRHMLGAFGVLVILCVLLVALIEHYSGADWAGDWIEHYQRVQFFVERQPYTTTFLDRYVIPSRPPMMHLIDAFFLGQIAERFDLFQVATTFLNVLAFFPCVLIAGQMSRRGSRRVWLIAAMLATSPLFVHNATFAWNKLFATFYIILSMGLYLRGWRQQSMSRMIAAAACMAAAILVHYSAAPYAIVLFLHYVWNFIWKRRPLAEVGACAGVVAFLLVTWFGWSIKVYGAGPTFESNTTVTDSRERESSAWAAFAENAFKTLVPHPLRQSPRAFRIDFVQPNPYGYVRDWFFNLYQPNLVFAFGLLAWVAVIWLTVVGIRTGDPPIARFWIAFLVIILPMGILVVGSVEHYGVAHVCLQPVVILGRTLLAAAWPRMQRRWREVIVGSLALDVLLGIILQARMQMYDIQALPRNTYAIVPLAPGLLNPQAAINSAYRFANHLLYLADQVGWTREILMVIVVFIMAAVIYALACAAVSGRLRLPRSFMPISAIFASLYLVGAMACLSNRVRGYTLVHTLSTAEAPTAEQFQAAIDPYVADVNARVESVDLYYHVGLIAYEFGQLQISLDALKNALLLDPEDDRARYLFYIIRIFNRLSLKPGDPLNLVMWGTYFDTPDNVLSYSQYIGRSGLRHRALSVVEQGLARFPNDEPLEARRAALLQGLDEATTKNSDPIGAQ